MTAPTSGRDGMAVRGAVVLVVAIIIGFALLYVSGRGDDDVSADAEPATTTTVEATSTAVATESTVPGDTRAPINTSSSVPEAPDDTRPPAEVTAVVLNGTTGDLVGVAADNSAKLETAGFGTLEAGNAFADLPVTTIYAGPDFQAEAEAIQGILGVPDAVVEVKPVDPVGDRSEEADVVVIVGDDVATG